jgi:hypothetical protein
MNGNDQIQLTQVGGGGITVTTDLGAGTWSFTNAANTEGYVLNIGTVPSTGSAFIGNLAGQTYAQIDKADGVTDADFIARLTANTGGTPDNWLFA